MVSCGSSSSSKRYSIDQKLDIIKSASTIMALVEEL